LGTPPRNPETVIEIVSNILRLQLGNRREVLPKEWGGHSILLPKAGALLFFIFYWHLNFVTCQYAEMGLRGEPEKQRGMGMESGTAGSSFKF